MLDMSSGDDLIPRDISVRYFFVGKFNPEKFQPEVIAISFRDILIARDDLFFFSGHFVPFQKENRFFSQIIIKIKLSQGTFRSILANLAFAPVQSFFMK